MLTILPFFSLEASLFAVHKDAGSLREGEWSPLTATAIKLADTAARNAAQELGVDVDKLPDAAEVEGFAQRVMNTNHGVVSGVVPLNAPRATAEDMGPYTTSVGPYFMGRVPVELSEEEHANRMMDPKSYNPSMWLCTPHGPSTRIVPPSTMTEPSGFNLADPQVPTEEVPELSHTKSRSPVDRSPHLSTPAASFSSTLPVLLAAKEDE